MFSLTGIHMTTQYRFYSFTAALYISPLQCGLQTAHAVSQMHADMLIHEEDQASFRKSSQREAFDTWATDDKTIIICNALNSAGVTDAYVKAVQFGHVFGLPTTIFYEDEISLNGAATASAIVVPDFYYEAKPYLRAEPAATGFFERLLKTLVGNNTPPVIEQGYRFTDADGNVTDYVKGSLEAEFISFLKSYRLA